MLNNFLQIVPEVIFDAAETLGGRCTGRFYTLHALENRVYDIEMEEGPALCHQILPARDAGAAPRFRPSTIS
jgi:hypothetical protein